MTIVLISNGLKLIAEIFVSFIGFSSISASYALPFTAIDKATVCFIPLSSYRRITMPFPSSAGFIVSMITCSSEEAICGAISTSDSVINKGLL